MSILIVSKNLYTSHIEFFKSKLCSDIKIHVTSNIDKYLKLLDFDILDKGKCYRYIVLDEKKCLQCIGVKRNKLIVDYSISPNQWKVKKVRFTDLRLPVEFI